MTTRAIPLLLNSLLCKKHLSAVGRIFLSKSSFSSFYLLAAFVTCLRLIFVLLLRLWSARVRVFGINFNIIWAAFFCWPVSWWLLHIIFLAQWRRRGPKYTGWPPEGSRRRKWTPRGAPAPRPSQVPQPDLSPRHQSLPPRSLFGQAHTNSGTVQDTPSSVLGFKHLSLVSFFQGLVCFLTIHQVVFSNQVLFFPNLGVTFPTVKKG